jgi:hypothetical protein
MLCYTTNAQPAPAAAEADSRLCLEFRHHTDLTESPYEKKKLFFKDASQKSAPLLQLGIAVEFVPWYQRSRFLNTARFPATIQI